MHVEVRAAGSSMACKGSEVRSPAAPPAWVADLVGRMPIACLSTAGRGMLAGMLLDLTPDELLATTRSVRKRLDLTRPVEPEVLEECLRLAQQAPTASYAQNWHFVVVTDPERRAALGELWRSAAIPYVERRASAAAADARVARISDAVRYLADHIHQVPVHVIPCVEGRTDRAPVVVQASRWGRSSRPPGASCWPPGRAGSAAFGSPSTCAMSGRRPSRWGSRSRR